MKINKMFNKNSEYFEKNEYYFYAKKFVSERIPM